MPENTVLVEGDAAVAGKIGFDIRAARNAIVQIAKPGNLALEGLHAPGKSIAQPRHDLEQREIDIADPAAGKIEAAIVLQQALEISEIFRHAFVPEFPRAPLGRTALLLVIQRR